MMVIRHKAWHYKSGALPTELSRPCGKLLRYRHFRLCRVILPVKADRNKAARFGTAGHTGVTMRGTENGPTRCLTTKPGLTTTHGGANMADAYPNKILPFLEGKIGELRMMRFWSKVDMRGPDECWEWQASVNKNGYGRFKLASYRMVTASRVALIGTKREEPDGLHVLHTCDNRPCCNPSHLYFGTVAQNNQDKVDRGRAATGDQSGASNGAAKLSEDQVVLIVDRFRRGMNNKQIAADLPVSHAMVSKIRRGHMWKPLTERLGWSPGEPYASTCLRAAGEGAAL